MGAADVCLLAGSLSVGGDLVAAVAAAAAVAGGEWAFVPILWWAGMGQRFLMILIHLEEVLVHFHLSRGLSLLCRECICLCLCLDLWAGLGSMELEVDIVHPAVAGGAGGANRFWEPFESAVAFAGMEAVAAALADLAWGAE